MTEREEGERERESERLPINADLCLYIELIEREKSKGRVYGLWQSFCYLTPLSDMRHRFHYSRGMLRLIKYENISVVAESSNIGITVPHYATC